MGRKRDLVAMVGNKVFSARKSEPYLAVLMLHHIWPKAAGENNERDMVVTSANLEKVIKYFGKRFTIDILENNLQKLAEGKALERPLMSLTFDDGYENFYKEVFPLIQKYKVPMNLNVIAKYADEKIPGYLTWAQIKEMQKSGLVEIGGHSYDAHTFVDGKPIYMVMPHEEIIKDFKKAAESFEKHLGAVPKIFAWPYGAVPKNIKMTEIKKFGYAIIMTTKSGVNVRVKDFDNLKRFAVLDYETCEKLQYIIEGYGKIKL